MIHTQRFNKGFTLIELLVVIAIIGILASVVLASLNSARDKGADAAVKSNLAGLISQAEIYYDNNARSYNSLCADATAKRQVDAAKLAYGGTADTYNDGTASTYQTSQCHDDPNAWAAIVPLRGSTASAPKLWCVDSTGVSKQVTNLLGSSIYACPAS